MSDLPSKDLAERRSVRRKDLSETENLTAEVADLATEVHKLRGTMTTYAPRTEMSKHFDKRIETLRNTLEQSARRQTIMWAASLVLIIGVLSFALVATTAINREGINDLGDAVRAQDERIQTLEDE